MLFGAAAALVLAVEVVAALGLLEERAQHSEEGDD
jgi:hypothetical protein